MSNNKLNTRVNPRMLVTEHPMLSRVTHTRTHARTHMLRRLMSFEHVTYDDLNDLKAAQTFGSLIVIRP
jgi:hypothetical protein